jgi:hypothetical protein
MTEQFGHSGFLVSIGVAVLLGLLFVLASRAYNTAKTPRKLSVDYFRTATSTSLTIVGLLAPVLVAVLSYFYLKSPTGDYSVLLATVVLLYVVLVLSVWATFAILRKAKGESAITLTFPADRKYITSMGLMYAFQLLALFLFAYFFLIDLPRSHVAEAPAPIVGGRLLLRPSLSLGASRDDVLRAWGAPSSIGGPRALGYSTDSSTIVVEFNESDRVSAIVERSDHKEPK